MRRKSRWVAITAIVLAAVVLVVGLTTVALASPPGPPGFVTASTPVSGTVTGKFNLNIAGFINFHTKGDLRVASQVFTIKPGGFVGWHSHPGPVLVIVKSGTFRSVQTDCSYKDYTAGQVYVDEGAGHVHNALNPSISADLELSVTYLAPPGVPLRDEADAITC
ncbi:MAG: hypothetical protein OEV29_10300 [Thermoleophilia bacterium]|nr:hypothetical protein [Thermoleophilia bacterium]MDH4341022.1 hypothetical protein [Thermoleophilia bacterium]